MSDSTEPADAIPVSARLGIIVSRFNASVTENLLKGAENELDKAEIAADQREVFWVPGAWEIPWVAQRLARSQRYAALIALGAVIRGQTTHDRQINRFVSLSIGNLSLQYDIPIAFGILTCQTEKQAVRRSDPQGRNKGGEAARTALDLIKLATQLPQQ